LAEVKSKTGAQMMVNEKDAPALEDGGSSDYAFGGTSTYQPIKADRLLRPDEIITLGDMQIKMLHHPGHTKGSCSYLLTAKDDTRSYQVLIANMPTIVVDKKLSEVSTYPTISEDLAATLKAMKTLSFDIWLASHASQFKLHDKRKAGDAYNPKAFMDRAGYDAALVVLQKQYEAKK
jgi:metallo-beta-lactamase class B